MAQNVRAINLVDFTGGLNMRGDAFELAPSESPNMLNVDLDARGGFVARKGWTSWNVDPVVGGTWDPRMMFVHEMADGTDRVYLANDGKIYHSIDGDTWTVLNDTTDIVAAADPHDADFAPWGDTLYIACGNVGTDAGVKVSSALVATRLTQAEGGNFSEYTAPVAAFPYANFIASHQGYIFAAGTEESGVKYPSRLRWSHFNNPEAWRSSDYQDFNEGGGPITGLIPMQDHLLIFKQSQVWALFGYDADSWQFVNVSRELGAPNRQAIARSEQAVFFYCHLNGIYAIANGETPREVSSALRPMFTDNDFNTALIDNIWLAWIGQRLWAALPFDEGATATDAVSVFVFDPSVGDGAWLRYRSGEDDGIGPFAQGGFSGGSGLKVGCIRSIASVLKLEDNQLPIDSVLGTELGFESYYVTSWVDAGAPTLKKSWRRPDFVLKQRTLEYDVEVEVFRDYDESNVVRSATVTVPAGASGAVWGSFTWGDGSLYGPAADGSTIERGATLGTARSVRLKLQADTGTPWGVDAIVLKFIPRRMR